MATITISVDDADMESVKETFGKAGVEQSIVDYIKDNISNYKAILASEAAKEETRQAQEAQDLVIKQARATVDSMVIETSVSK